MARRGDGSKKDPFIKDPNAKKDYKFDFKALTNGSGIEDYLVAGELIDTIAVVPITGLTITDESKTDNSTSVTIWVASGTVDTRYGVVLHFTTNMGRIDDRTMWFLIQEE